MDTGTEVFTKDPNGYSMRRLTVSIRVHARVRAGLYRRSRAYERLYIDGPAVCSKCRQDDAILGTATHYG